MSSWSNKIPDKCRVCQATLAQLGRRRIQFRVGRKLGWRRNYRQGWEKSSGTDRGAGIQFNTDICYESQLPWKVVCLSHSAYQPGIS